MSPIDTASAVAHPGVSASAAVPAWPPCPSKIQAWHHERLAIVYVRQSSPQQILEHRESTALQYALSERAKAWGWSHTRILVIDEDQGQSGRTAANRSGFQRLLLEVNQDRVGLILGLEMSRLARSNKDWHHLLEVCALVNTLLADPDGVYDPCLPNDRLLLGLKGTMSEAELYTMRSRLYQGRLNKARRGELFTQAPSGYVRVSPAGLALDPDAEVQHVVGLLFDQFEAVGSAPVASLLGPPEDSDADPSRLRPPAGPVRVAAPLYRHPAQSFTSSQLLLLCRFRSVVQSVEAASDCVVSSGRTALLRCASIAGSYCDVYGRGAGNAAVGSGCQRSSPALAVPSTQVCRFFPRLVSCVRNQVAINDSV